MHKIAHKFIVSIVLVLSLASLTTILFNTQYLERYYLAQKKQTLLTVSQQLTKQLKKTPNSGSAISKIEKNQQVVIAQVSDATSLDNNTLNEAIRSALQAKNIGFQKYWLWQQDYQDILKGQQRVRLYQQQDLSYSLLVNYVQIKQQLFAVTMIIPDISDAFKIINHFLIAVNLVTIAIAIILIILLVRNITKPLGAFERFAANMQKNKFVPLVIQTQDELATVATSLNTMGQQLDHYQTALKTKNAEMTQLMNNVAHDLKTPIALIQLYATGLKDGLDDGTFLETITNESQQMATALDRLLYLSRIEQEEVARTTVDLTALVQKLIQDYQPLATSSQRVFAVALEAGLKIKSSEALLTSLLMNLITNSVKYAASSEIKIRLFQTKTEINFLITNTLANNDLNFDQMWAPYYVGETSRNKNLSGTGLGLSIVAKICQKLHYSITYKVKDQQITFWVTLPKS